LVFFGNSKWFLGKVKVTMNAKTQFAKELRKDQTKAEEIVWREIRNRKFLGLRFKRQFIIEGFIVDFYCDEFALAIEIDGRIHEK